MEIFNSDNSIIVHAKTDKHWGMRVSDSPGAMDILHKEAEAVKVYHYTIARVFTESLGKILVLQGWMTDIVGEEFNLLNL